MTTKTYTYDLIHNTTYETILSATFTTVDNVITEFKVDGTDIYVPNTPGTYNGATVATRTSPPTSFTMDGRTFPLNDITLNGKLWYAGSDNYYEETFSHWSWGGIVLNTNGIPWITTNYGSGSSVAILAAVFDNAHLYNGNYPNYTAVQARLDFYTPGATAMNGPPTSITCIFSISKTYDSSAGGGGGGGGGGGVIGGGTIWSQQGAKIQPTTNNPSSNVGSSVSLSYDGNSLAFGANSELDQNGYQTGATWIYNRNGATGTWSENTKLVGTDFTSSSNQGISVSLSYDGNTLAVGSDMDNSYTGAVWIFNKNEDDNTWSQNGNKLTLSGIKGISDSGSNFGRSVHLSGYGKNLFIGTAAGAGSGSYPYGLVVATSGSLSTTSSNIAPFYLQLSDYFRITPNDTYTAMKFQNYKNVNGVYTWTDIAVLNTL